MRELLLNPPEVSPWNSTGLFQPPTLKKKKKNTAAAWSGQRLKIHSGAAVSDAASDARDKMTEEEVEAARQVARSDARAKRRAASMALANFGMSSSALGENQSTSEVPSCGNATLAGDSAPMSLRAS